MEESKDTLTGLRAWIAEELEKFPGDRKRRYVLGEVLAKMDQLEEPREAIKFPDTLELPAPAGMARVETGPVSFGRDWPGVFIRGDNAMWYSMNLRFVKTDHFLASSCVEELRELLRSCQVR